MNKKYYVISFAVTFMTAFLGSLASISAQSYYKHLVKPEWAPPPFVFGPVWSVLYVLMAISGGIAISHAKDKGKPALWFLGQLFLNGLWSWAFFKWESGAGSILVIAGLWISILFTMVSFWKISRPATWMLVPYICWVTFAAALNFAIWRLNQGKL